jgi:hypothetical protein
MKIMDAKGLMLGAIFSTVACFMQIIAFIRFLGRLPEDGVGITLFILTIIAFTFGAFGFYIQWRKVKRNEESVV